MKLFNRTYYRTIIIIIIIITRRFIESRKHGRYRKQGRFNYLANGLLWNYLAELIMKLFSCAFYGTI